MAIIKAMTEPHPILCCRELQNSIKDSVHSLLVEQIQKMGVSHMFEIGESFIRCPSTGAFFLFKGLRTNAAEIKSMNGIKYAWVEEAQSVSQKSLEYLLPTIRVDDSEIWFSWNPLDELDPVHDMLVTNLPENAIVEKINYYDNPFFPNVLEEERQRVLKYQPQRYEWIWEGNFNTNTDGAVYGKWIAAMEREGRIKQNIYDPSLPVMTAWDLGYSDDTAIWWFQVAGNEVRLIDYYENNREGIKHYAEQIYGREITGVIYGENGAVMSFNLGKPIDGAGHRQTYRYSDHYVPHDAANKLMQAGGRSVVNQLHELGVKSRVVAATSQQNQIEAARLTLGNCWADPVMCKDGIRALRKYQFLFDEQRNRYLDKPDHDSFSHANDAFEVIAQVWKSPKKPEEKRKLKPLNEMTFNDIIAQTSHNTGYDRI